VHPAGRGARHGGGPVPTLCAPGHEVGGAACACSRLPSWLLRVVYPLPTLCRPRRSEEDAFKNSVECITGPISRIISTQGMPAVYEALDAEGKEEFKQVRP